MWAIIIVLILLVGAVDTVRLTPIANLSEHRVIDDVTMRLIGVEDDTVRMDILYIKPTTKL